MITLADPTTIDKTKWNNENTYGAFHQFTQFQGASPNQGQGSFGGNPPTKKNTFFKKNIEKLQDDGKDLQEVVDVQVVGYGVPCINPNYHPEDPVGYYPLQKNVGYGCF